MSIDAITVHQLGRVFCRSLHGTLIHGMHDQVRKLIRRRDPRNLGRDEFWALRDISFSVAPGECLGIIGPNGAGKSTLLKLVNRDLRPSVGTVSTAGSVKALIRIGTGLQPMLSGRENIYAQCSQLGLNKKRTDGLVDGIISFAELQEAIDAPVKTYSNGMYARLEFAIATSFRTDVLLVDEVLAVGDIAFQLRALDRLNRLKREGTAVVFVSHSEMNVRQVADRCLLLFAGRQVALGETDALFYKYYESIGYLNRQLKPLGATPPMPQDLTGEAAVLSLEIGGITGMTARTGEPLVLEVTFNCRRRPVDRAEMTVQFWNSAGILVASVDSRTRQDRLRLPAGESRWRVELPFLPLTAGVYRIAAGLSEEGRALAFAGGLAEIVVHARDVWSAAGLLQLDARIERADY